MASFLDIVIEGDRERLAERLRARLAGDEGSDIGSTTVIRKDGSHVEIEYSVRRIDDPSDPARRSMIAIIRDLTERREAEAQQTARVRQEAQLQEAERFRGLIEHSYDVVALLDAQGRILYDSPAKTRVLGYVGEELYGVSAFELIHPDDLPAVQEKFVRLVSSPAGIEQATFRLRHKDGSWRWVDATGSNLLQTQPVNAVVVNYRDVTDVYRARAAQDILAQTGSLLTASTEHEKVLEGIARLLVPSFADWCSISTVEDDGQLTRRALAHADPEKLKWAREVVSRYPLDPDAPRGPARVIRTGRSELISHISDEVLRTAARDDEQFRLLREAGLRSAITVPLNARGKTLGALTAVSAESGRIYDSADLALAEELGNRCALAIDASRLFAQERRAREAAEVGAGRARAAYAVSSIVLQARSVEEAAVPILEAIGTHTGWNFGGLWLASREGHLHGLSCVATWHSPGEEFEEFTRVTMARQPRPGQGFVGRAWAEGVFIYEPDLSQRADSLRRDPAVRAGLICTMTIPLRASGGVVGVMDFWGRGSRQPDEAIRETYMSIGDQVGQFIERAQIARLVLEMSTPVLPIADRLLLIPLTGTFNPERAALFQSRLLGTIRSHRALVAVVDVTGVAVMDTYAASQLIQATQTARLLGCHLILSGVSADASRSLVMLGVDMRTVHTTRDVEQGLEYAYQILAARVSGGSGFSGTAGGRTGRGWPESETAAQGQAPAWLDDR
jgi:PAS domain S-box-containing protein